MSPFVSVIVPVRNEEAFIRNTLEQLLGQEYDPACFEVIVVDGESTDATPRIVRAMQADYANLQLYPNPRRLSSAARNIGVLQAQGDILVFVDGHCELRSTKYLQDVVAAFERSGGDCLGRPQPLDVTGATRLQQAIATARSSWLGHHPSSWIYAAAEQFVPPQSVAIAYRRSVFLKVGFFDETFDACEDVEFNHRVDRAGLRCFFTPRVQVHYFPRASLRGLFRQMARYGRGRVRLLRKHPDTFSVPSSVPAAFVTGLATGPLLFPFSPWFAGAYFGGLSLYVLVVLFVSLVMGLQKRSLSLCVRLPLVFATIHLGIGTGSLREWLAGPPQEPDRSRAPTGQPALEERGYALCSLECGDLSPLSGGAKSGDKSPHSKERRTGLG